MVYKRLVAVLLISFFTVNAYGYYLSPPDKKHLTSQEFKDRTFAHILKYKNDFLTDGHSPLKATDTGYLRFYEPDEQYNVTATVLFTPGEKPFGMVTHGGGTAEYRKYAIIYFTLNNVACQMEVYQNQRLMKDEKYKDDLFLPFTDETTNIETYGGGRYLDLSIKDIVGNKIMIDFNKCYNPYCAYAEGYACPLVPTANRLKTAVKAGEKKWAKGE